MLDPGLCISQGIFSASKTVNSVRDGVKFDPFRQVNIFNQPTGYNHILIESSNDLINVLLDIYNYHLYFNSYEEKLEQYELYKQTRLNLKNIPYPKLMPRALNIVKSPSRWKNIKTNFGIWLGKIPVCVLMDEQLDRKITHLEKYFKKREEFTKLYGDDLLLGYFNYIFLDELQLYFGNRNFKKNFEGKNAFLKDFIAFPVKLNSRISGVVQNIFTLDIMFRRQSSIYRQHISKFFGLVQKTYEFDVKDTEKPSFSEEEIISSRTNINFYQLFGLPKVQYYRNHLILEDEKNDVYVPGMYFRHIRCMTDRYIQIHKIKE